jgi:hypothetical protein
MQWLQANGFWIAIVVFFLWMHLGMHGGHGGHGGSGCCGGGGHQHGADEDAAPNSEENEHAGH